MTRLCCIVFLILKVVVLTAAPRVWTDSAGRQVEAEFVEIDHGHVKIKRVPDGQLFSFPIKSLSQQDQEYLRKLTDSARRASSNVPLPPFVGLVWPRRVGLPDDYDVEVVKEDSATGEYIYRTPHFEFHSDVKLARKVVREFGKIFEATYVAMKVFPLEWKPQPSETYFKTRLFESKEDYLEAGGLPNSGGTYNGRIREILVPLASLGLKKSSSSYTLDDSEDHTTLIHEITHQIHHAWIQRLPPWMTEGMAVYMESVPYNKGEFRFDQRDVEQYISSRNFGQPSSMMVPLEGLMTMSHREWNSNFADNSELLSQYYRSAFLLMNYYLHLDGEGEGRRIYAYCRAIESGQSADEAMALLLDGRSFDEVTAQLIVAYKREGLEIQIGIF